MLRVDSLQPHTKIFASSNKEFAKSSIVCVRPMVCSFQSNRFRRNSTLVSVTSQARRSFAGSDVWGGFLQVHRWRGKTKKTRASSSSCEQDNNLMTPSLNDKSQVNFDEKQESSLSPLKARTRFVGFLGALILMMLLFVLSKLPTMTFVSITYSEFLSKIDSNQIQKVEVDGVSVRFILKEIEMNEGRAAVLNMAPKEQTVYMTSRPNDRQTPYQKMLEKGVEFGSRDKLWDNFDIMSMCVFLLKLSIICYVFGRIYSFLQESISKDFLKKLKKKIRHIFFLKSRKSKQGEAVTFADVGGVDEVKKDLKEIVEFLRHPDRSTLFGARPPRGVILVGLPGTGKTLLAKAVAGEAEVPFISFSVNDFGLGPSRVRGLFARARKEAPSVVFIDEIDEITISRLGYLRDFEKEETFKQLLTEMDGLDGNSEVIVLGAANREDALLPTFSNWRFDSVVMVETPDFLGREAILKIHVLKKEVPAGEDVDLGEIASMTTGFTGEDLANVVSNAALLARRINKVIVEKTEFIQAVLISGMEKDIKLLGSEKAVVARHEVGHAVVGTAVAKLLPRLPRVETLSLLPRSEEVLVFEYPFPTLDIGYVFYMDEFLGRLVTFLGGHAAEEFLYSGCVSTGALDDMRRATDMLYKPVAEYYLNENIGPMLSGGKLDVSEGGASRGSDQGHLVDIVQEEVRAILQSALEVALSVVYANFIVLEGLGAHLEGKERVEGEELQEWLKLVVAPKELSAFINSNQKQFDVSNTIRSIG